MAGKSIALILEVETDEDGLAHAYFVMPDRSWKKEIATMQSAVFSSVPGSLNAWTKMLMVAMAACVTASGRPVTGFVNLNKVEDN